MIACPSTPDLIESDKFHLHRGIISLFLIPWYPIQATLHATGGFECLNSSSFLLGIRVLSTSSRYGRTDQESGLSVPFRKFGCLSDTGWKILILIRCYLDPAHDRAWWCWCIWCPNYNGVCVIWRRLSTSEWQGIKLWSLTSLPNDWNSRPSVILAIKLYADHVSWSEVGPWNMPADAHGNWGYIHWFMKQWSLIRRTNHDKSMYSLELYHAGIKLMIWEWLLGGMVSMVWVLK